MSASSTVSRHDPSQTSGAGAIRAATPTIIVGRDPEIAVPRPPDITGILLNIFALKSSYLAMRGVLSPGG